ncbi:MAG: rod shape-determining protein RodA [Bdellovibrionales bacterium RIFOXYA1_FULL_36_14]|nr:MAG: rod shape-determining protein RodA [Bdellovibrionales bacterium RIFOXYA1_FULL_36_14]
MNYSAILETLKKYDFSFFGAVIAIFFIGVINLYSATQASDQLSHSNLFKIQLFYFLISMAIALTISFVQTKNYFRYGYFIYGVNVFLLILVLTLGKIGMGAQRWLVLGPISFQPSEFMKISIVLALGRWFTKTDPHLVLGFKELIIPAIITFIPMILIVLQPDLGTGILVGLISFMIAFYRRLRWKVIVMLGIISLIGGSVMYQYGLKEYQRKRIIAFVNPDADAKGSGYNAIQSKIAIGSGEFLGKGYKKSTQASLQYLPENHTDFIFSIFNEEHGFFGSLVLISLYIVLFYRFIWLAQAVTKIFDSILAVGLMSIFFWHTFINMGMVMGLMPIVGVPLPLLSYGGTSLLTFMICCGVATSISNSRNFF